ncbi:MAG TPA: ribose 5-phosphate isomerase B [Planctomycetota bacterium]|nr:ribose 5-phosphate isomerase B [Planctomycetota bacterium]
MRIAVGSDHAGFELKAALIEELRARGAEVTDCGTAGAASCDYPEFGAAVAGMVADGRAERGVLVCGTGQGMCMTANRFPAVRAALVYDEMSARITRQHNNANVICLGARVLAPAEARRLLGLWLETPFDGDRHLRRVRKIDSVGPCGGKGE